MRSSAVQSSLLGVLVLAMGCGSSGPLPEAGVDLSNVLQVTTRLADVTDDPRHNEIHREYYTAEPLPTPATVAVRESARGARVEMTMVAVG